MKSFLKTSETELKTMRSNEEDEMVSNRFYLSCKINQCNSSSVSHKKVYKK